MITQQEQEPPKNIADRMRDSVMAKLAFIAVLALALLIPSAWIQSLINERSLRQDEVTREVAASWSDTQTVKGPMLIIPYKYYIISTDAKGKGTTEESERYIRVLPDQLHLKADVNTFTKHRGIFEAVLYNSQIKVSGVLPVPDFKKLAIDPANVQFNRARLVFGISDMRGLKNTPIITVGTAKLTAEPIIGTDTGIDDGLQVTLPPELAQNRPIPFSFTLDVKGSRRLGFMHLAKATDVEVTGNWRSPSFEGRYLPDESRTGDKGFSASWKMAFNRSIPQQWAGNTNLIDAEKVIALSSFGVKLLTPVDQYQQTMRTSKYAALIIVLTFISLFLTELIRRQQIHIFNYALIGAAMIVFYTLLLSFSEKIGYNWAYLLAAASTISLISWFTASLLKNTGAAVMFAFILSVFYGFIFVIIQLEDMALMVGSIALFIVVALLMYFSRKISWDKR